MIWYLSQSGPGDGQRYRADQNINNLGVVLREDWKSAISSKYSWDNGSICTASGLSKENKCLKLQIVRESGRGLGAVEGSGEERNWSKFPVILMFPVWAGREERLNSNTIDGILLPGYWLDLSRLRSLNYFIAKNWTIDLHFRLKSTSGPVQTFYFSIFTQENWNCSNWRPWS